MWSWMESPVRDKKFSAEPLTWRTTQMVCAPEEPLPVHTDGPSVAARADELCRLQPAASVKHPIMWHNQIKGAGCEKHH